MQSFRMKAPIDRSWDEARRPMTLRSSSSQLTGTFVVPTPRRLVGIDGRRLEVGFEDVGNEPRETAAIAPCQLTPLLKHFLGEADRNGLGHAGKYYQLLPSVNRDLEKP